MVADVIQFPVKKCVTPTPEELQAIKLQNIEDFIDTSVSNFLVSMFESISDIDKNKLDNIDTPTQKIIALVRESMRATIYKFQGTHHDLQLYADEIIYFDDDVKEQIIEAE